MLVHDLLRRSAAHTPDATLAVHKGKTASYAEVDRRSNRIAHVLAQHGVQRGDRVILALENSIEFIACYFGILKAGAIAVPLAPGARSDRLPHAVRDCTPAACVLDSATLEALAAAVPASTLPPVLQLDPGREAQPIEAPAGVQALDLRELVKAAPDAAPDVRCIDVDLAAIIYTSGSTGAPRGVMLSHLGICANTASITSYLRLTAADRVLVVLPFYYVYGLSLLHTHVAVGGSVVIDPYLAFPNVVLQTMRDHAVTGFAGVPSTFALLLHRSRIADMSFPHLRYATQAGGAMPPALIREWQRARPDVPLYVMYGATEAAARLAYLDPVELAHRPASIGRAIPNVDLVLVKDDGSLALPGEVGEIVARGSNIMVGYWNRPDETRAAFGPHGYHTGDLAVMDQDGFLQLVGRRQEMIKVGAHRVGPREIEDVLAEHPAVHEVAVLGMPHDFLGEVPVAFLVLRQSRMLTEADLLGFCRRRLPEHKVPLRIVIRDELPKSGAGKIQKDLLRRALHQVADAPDRSASLVLPSAPV